MDRDIFISYIEEDGAVARALATELRSLGPSTWTYEEDGVAGISYLTQVHRAIETCRAFVLVASEKSVNANQVIREVEQAHEREKIIIAVRLGMSHQQFVASNPILRMATGTAVTLAAEEGNLPAIGKRIAATLAFAKPQTEVGQARETPVSEQSAVNSVATGPAAPTQVRAVGQTGPSKAEAVPSPQVSPSVTVSVRDVSDASVRLRSTTLKWLWPSVCLGIIGQVAWAGLWVIFFSTLVVDSTARDSLALAILGANVAALVCAVLLARSFVIMRRSSAAVRTQDHAVTQYLLFSIISVVTMFVSIGLKTGVLDSIAFLVLLPFMVCIALVWNGLRVLRRAADRASE
jgi:TIR domain